MIVLVPILFLIAVVVFGVVLTQSQIRVYLKRLKDWDAFAEAYNLDLEINLRYFRLKGVFRNLFVELSPSSNTEIGFLRLTLITSREDVVKRMKAISLADEDEKLLIAWRRLDGALRELNLLPKYLKFDANQSKMTFHYPEDLITLNKVYGMTGQIAEVFDLYLDVFAFGTMLVPDLEAILDDGNQASIPSTVLSRHIAQALLDDLARETTRRFSGQLGEYCCLRCYTNMGRYQTNTSILKRTTYYGCRECGHSRVVFTGKVAAILDNQSQEKLLEENDTLGVNWLVHRNYFDFDHVKIIEATDEEVERFAVHIGNDMDKQRKKRYEKMSCVVQQNCELSENSIRILKRTFGRVVT